MPIRWQCPIAIATRTYTAKSDVYSMGVLLWEIYSGGATPYAELAAGEIMAAVRAGHRLARPTASTEEGVVALIRACTQMDVPRRPAMAEVLQRIQTMLSGDVPLNISVLHRLVADRDAEEESYL